MAFDVIRVEFQRDKKAVLCSSGQEESGQREDQEDQRARIVGRRSADESTRSFLGLYVNGAVTTARDGRESVVGEVARVEQRDFENADRIGVLMIVRVHVDQLVLERWHRVALVVVENSFRVLHLKHPNDVERIFDEMMKLTLDPDCFVQVSGAVERHDLGRANLDGSTIRFAGA